MPKFCPRPSLDRRYAGTQVRRYAGTQGGQLGKGIGYDYSGYFGRRLWPLSRKSYPKQFADLGQPDTLFQATVKRLAGKGFRRPVLLTSEDYRFIVTEQMGGVGVLPEAIFIEPEPRDTAPAVLIARIVLAAPVIPMG